MGFGGVRTGLALALGLSAGAARADLAGWDMVRLSWAEGESRGRLSQPEPGEPGLRVAEFRWMGQEGEADLDGFDFVVACGAVADVLTILSAETGAPMPSRIEVRARVERQSGFLSLSRGRSRVFEVEGGRCVGAGEEGVDL